MLIKPPPSNKNYRIEIGLRIWNNKTHHPKNFPAREARRKIFWTLLAVLQGENAKKRSFWGSKKLMLIKPTTPRLLRKVEIIKPTGSRLAQIGPARTLRGGFINIRTVIE